MNSREVISNTHTVALGNKGYEMQRGWDDEVAAAIVTHSREPHIMASTPRDALNRFSSIEAAHYWHDSHSRVIYGLFHAAELAGLIWYSESPHPEARADVTFAIRLYEKSRGQGLASPFLRASEEDFRDHTGFNDTIWLSTSVDNTIAQTLYFRAGYDEITREDDRIIMTKGGTI